MNSPQPPRGLRNPTSRPTGSPSNDLLITSDLLRRAKRGDQDALDSLMARYRPRLVRWATGRLPPYARSLFDTGDLVQETLLAAIRALKGIEDGAAGNFQAYVRQTVLNRIRDQVRWARKREGTDQAPEDLEDATPSPLEKAIEADVLARYERALAQLTEIQQLMVHLRIELHFSYEEIAAITEHGSPDAARMAVQRAVRKLAEIMGHQE